MTTLYHKVIVLGKSIYFTFDSKIGYNKKIKTSDLLVERMCGYVAYRNVDKRRRLSGAGV